MAHSRLPSTTCIITNHNYGGYLADCILSALNQDLAFSEIIVVDDCSDDNSVEIVQRLMTRHESIRLIRSETNQGQLASFQVGFGNSSSDIIFFLDADDIYDKFHCSSLTNVFSALPSVDFCYSRHVEFTGHAPFDTSRQTCRNRDPEISDLGYSLIRVLLTKVYIGGPTSCLAIRRRTLSKILSFPDTLLEDWRTRADDCLVFGASLVGARKAAVSCRSVGYRRHDKNAFLDNQTRSDPSLFFARQVALMRLWKYFSTSLYLHKTIISTAYLEFKTVPRPSRKLLSLYLRTVWRYGSGDVSRIKASIIILRHFLVSRANPTSLQ